MLQLCSQQLREQYITKNWTSHPLVPLNSAFDALSAYSWFLLNLPSVKTPRSFSQNPKAAWVKLQEIKNPFQLLLLLRTDLRKQETLAFSTFVRAPTHILFFCRWCLQFSWVAWGSESLKEVNKDRWVVCGYSYSTSLGDISICFFFFNKSTCINVMLFPNPTDNWCWQILVDPFRVLYAYSHEYYFLNYINWYATSFLLRP